MDHTTDKRIFLDSPVFSWVITALIIYSVVCFSLSTLPDLSDESRQYLRFSEIAITVVFTLEYFSRLFLSERPIKFMFSFYGLIDLLAILPFYMSFMVDLRTLRLLRLLRLIRILKLARYNKALSRFIEALLLAKEELLIFSFASLIVLYLSAVGIYHFEHPAQPEVFKSIFDCLWWAVATLTTVGYGDIYPITVGGRLFTFLVLMVGLGLVAVPTGIVASSLSAVRRRQSSVEK